MTIIDRIVCFLSSRLNWILLLVGLQGILLVFGLLDHDLDFSAILYVAVFNILVITLFLFFTYIRETSFLKKLSEMREIEELKHKEVANTRMEQHILNYLYAHIARQKKIVSRQATMLKEQEQDLTHFVHEMKTPLTALKLLIENEEDKVQKLRLLFEWSRMNAMLDNQLYLVRIDSKHRDTYLERVNLKRMIIEEVQLTRHISQQKGLGFDINIEENYEVFTDMKWCKMLLRQLISNAVKYSFDGEEIMIQAYIKNNHVHLCIQDNGRGISKSDIPRIYDRGFTSTHHRNETTSSGIGLYLVSRIKDTLNLEVEITSEENNGTSAVVVFPNPNEMIQKKADVTELSF